MLLAAACGGPHVERTDHDQYLHGRYRRVIILPFEGRGDLTADDLSLLEGWLEQELTARKVQVQGRHAVELRVQDAGAKTEPERRKALLAACEALDIRGFWHGRAEMSLDENRRTHMTLVVRLTSVKTGELVVQIDGHDRVDPGGGTGEPLWKAWRELTARMIAELDE